MLTSTSVGLDPVPDNLLINPSYTSVVVLTRSELFVVSTPEEIVKYLGHSGSQLLFGDVPRLLPFNPPGLGLITEPVFLGLHGITEVTVDIAAVQSSKIQKNKVNI